MRVGWWMGLAACVALPACAPDSGSYYGSVQPAYDSYAQPGYYPPAYAEPGYLVPDGGPGYVRPYDYPVPVTPGFGYGGGREFRGDGFREREFRREFQERGDRERRFRDDRERFDRERVGREQFERSRGFEQRPPPPPREQPRPPPGQTPPLPGGIFPGVPRPTPHQ